MRKTVLIVALSAAFVVTMAGQVRRDTRPVLVIRDTGKKTIEISPPPPPPPPELSAAAKADLFKSVNASGPGSQYFKLSPNVPYRHQKGWLEFIDAHRVDGSGSANWQQSNHGVIFTLRAEGGERRYLMDCLVDGGTADYKIQTINHKVLQTFASDQNHLVFLLETNDTFWHSVEITGGPDWWFFSCEATRVTKSLPANSCQKWSRKFFIAPLMLPW